MVDNQHRRIKGYRDLSQGEIDLMNEAKILAERVGDFCAKLSTSTVMAVDSRRLAIGKTDLQKGFMAVVRSIAKPETF